MCPSHHQYEPVCIYEHPRHLPGVLTTFVGKDYIFYHGRENRAHFDLDFSNSSYLRTAAPSAAPTASVPKEDDVEGYTDNAAPTLTPSTWAALATAALVLTF